MHLRLLTAPDAIVTTAEAKAHLRIYHDDEDAYIDGLVAAATANIDGAEGWLGRAIGPQQWEMTVDRFPCNDPFAFARVRHRGFQSHGVVALNIPLPPLISIEEIEYDDPDGVATELTSGNYRLLGTASTGGAYVLPLANTEWPATQCEPGSVRVSFTAGYAVVPPSIKHAILLIVSHLFEHREENQDTGAKFGLLELPFGAKSLLTPHRFYS